MAAIFNIAAISQVVGKGLRVVPVSTGFQVNLELREYTTDLARVDRMKEAMQALRDAGYEIEDRDFRISAPGRDDPKKRVPWVCIFVSRKEERRQPAQQVVVIPTPEKLLEMKAAGFSAADLVALYGSASPARIGAAPTHLLEDLQSEHDPALHEGEGVEETPTENPI